MSWRLVAALFLLLITACGSPPAASGPTHASSRSPSASAAPHAPAPVDELDRPLPLDARITKGSLENGLRYYILPHKKPEQRAQLCLAVNAGSVIEDEDQRGLAHFVEHMSFNGTKRFPKQELVAFLEKSGVRFGADLNAYTSFDETVYTLQIPTENSEIVGRALSVLRDWTDAVTFDPGEIDKERGVILEERRLGRGARMRILDKQAPVLFYKSKYAERITIGKPEIIRDASQATLLRYYRDWYRPDLMAVVAVGDFEASDMEARIRAEFSSLTAPATPRPRPDIKLPAHEDTLVSIETDREMPTTSVTLLSKLPRRPERSARDYRRAVGEQLYSSMLNARLDELLRDPNAPFLAASSGTSGFVRTADVSRQTAVVKEDGIERGFGALLEEVLRVERHGFTEPELDRAKRRLLRQFQQAAKERDKTAAAEFAAEIVRNFLEDEAMPGREAELALVERFLPTFTLTELNGVAKIWGAGSRVITVSGPPTMVEPAPAALLALSKDVAARDIQPYVDAGPTEPLMKEPPARGAVASTITIPEIGVTEWKLANGVRVIVKVTDFSNDEVRMSAFSPGGTSLVRDADYISAEFADEAVSQGGLGPFDAVKLRKALAGRLAWVRSRIGELDEGLAGGASAGDVETLLQLSHLSFTAPRHDPRAFSAWRTREIERVRNSRLSPERTFYEEMLAFSAQNHARRRPTTPEILAKIDLDKALSVYKDRFADASDFTFIFVGNIDIERLRPLVETYLGSLPGAKRQESWRDVRVLYPNGVKTKVVQKGSEPKSLVSMTFHGSGQWSYDAENDLRSLSDALRYRLRQVLREDLGGVYGVQVNAIFSRRPRQEYRVAISFGCSPENVDKLKQAVFNEVKGLRDIGVGDEVIAKMKETRRRAHEINLKNNGFWLSELERAYTFGDDPRRIPDIAPVLAAIREERVRAAAKKHLNPKQYVLGVLVPEDAPRSAAAP